MEYQTKNMYFRMEDKSIHVGIGEDGLVNVAATGPIDVTDFAQLAYAILHNSNYYTGQAIGLDDTGRLYNSE